jgi:methylamine---corrinoid protein Co-methyltransferase
MPVSIYELYDRAEYGRKQREQDFDMGMVKEVRGLLEQYPEIKYDEGEIVPSQDSLADQLFEAAVELATRVGLFIMDTGRVVHFTRGEILTALDRLPAEQRIGAGKDEKVVCSRKFESPDPLLVIAGPTASPLAEGDAFVRIHQSYAQEEVVDLLSTGHPMTIQGRDIKATSPMEIQAAISDVAWIREAMRRANRPDMPMETGPAIATFATSVAAAISEEIGIRRTDLGVVAMLNEMKTDFERLNRHQLFTQQRVDTLALVDPVIGGYAGPPEGAALVGLAARILSVVTYGSKAGIFHPCHMNLKLGTTSHPMTMWVQNVVGQAATRNSGIVVFANVFTSARCNTKMILYEIAANTIGIVASGCHVGPGVGGAVGSEYLDSCSGLEARFMGEVAHATSRLSRQQANEIVKQILPKYVDDLQSPPQGSRFQDCYDYWTLKPSDEWLGKYHQVREELIEFGIRMEIG